MKILLDYVFPVTVISPTPQASTAFLKQACLLAKPKGAVPDGVTLCTSMSQVLALTDNTNAQQLFNAGMNRVFICVSDTLDVAELLAEEYGEFYTVLVSDDFDDSDVTGTASSLVKANLTFTAKEAGEDGDEISIAFITGGSAGSEVVTVVDKAISVSMATTTSTANQLKAALDASPAASALISTTVASGQGSTGQAAFAVANLAGGVNGLTLGALECVVGLSTQSTDFAASQAAIGSRAAFFCDASGAKNMCFAFGSLLSNSVNWLNQQYIEMPEDDGVDELGEAEALFDDKVSFVITDDEYSERLALFAAGGKAIVAPYISKNIRIDMQSRALSWIAANQPQYTNTEAALLETRLQEDVINLYISRRWITAGTVSVTIDPTGNFVASGEINISEPKALWRVVSEMRQTL